MRVCEFFIRLGAGVPTASFHPIVYGLFCPPDLVSKFFLLVEAAPVPTVVNLDKIA
jgi:hypothetical protein